MELARRHDVLRLAGASPMTQHYPWKILVLVSLSIACSRSRTEPRLVDVAKVDPTLAFEIRYGGTDNFVGDVIDGYEDAKCMLTPEAAAAVGRVQRALRPQGLGLLIFDCYRPQRAVNHFVRWAEDLNDQRQKARFYPNVEKSELLRRGYIARESSHSRGSTVDLGLIHLSSPDRGRSLDMGTEFDLFDPRSHTDAPDITPQQRINRERLVDAMSRAGFENLPVEWWHYTLRDEPYPDTYFDVVVGSRDTVP